MEKRPSRRNMGSGRQRRNGHLNRYLTTAQAAAYMGVSKRTLENDRRIPRFNIAQPGRARAMIRFDRRTIDIWIVRLGKNSTPGGAS